LIANGIGIHFHRFDLTSIRYTLSETSLNIIEQVKALVHKIYMQELPAEFKRLQQETQQLLEEFQAYNKTSFSLSIHWKMKTPAWTT
jgi:hypothetical protein